MTSTARPAKSSKTELVFADSAPDGASVYLNDAQYRDQTNTRAVLPEGHYDLLIRKDGYRDWRRSFELKGGAVERFTYPLLLPNNLEQQEVASYAQPPTFSTQSPDQHWLLFSKGASISEFTEYDTTNVSKDEKLAERSVSFPSELFTTAEGAHSVELVEWSNDNKHVLVKHSFVGGFEFIVLNREAPATSININKLLAQAPTSVSLRDKKFDEWYLYNQTGGQLIFADTKKTITPLLNGVGTYKSHDTDTLVYSQPVVNSPNQRIF